MTAHK